MRLYCNNSPPSASEEVVYHPDMTLEDYGLPEVRLDSEKYYEAFSNSKWFQSPNELAWMLWQPPKSITRPDEWLEMNEARGKEDHDKTAHPLELLVGLASRMTTLKHFKDGGKNAFLSVIDYINDGDLEALENSLSPPCYNYVSGWLAYMKEHGYTWQHSIETIEEVNPIGMTTLVVYNEGARGEGVSYIDGAHISAFARPVGDKNANPTNLGMLLWAEIVAQEQFTIRDSSGATILSSPLKRHRHVWKFGAAVKNSKSVLTDLALTVHDIDHQVILRAADILTKEKLFLDSNAPRAEVWHMTRPM